MRCIIRYGFDGTSIGRICAEAKIARGLINHHFGTKDELLRRLYEDLWKEWDDRVGETIRMAEGGPEDRLRTMVRAMFSPGFFQEEKLAVWIGFWSASGRSVVLKKVLHNLYRGEVANYAKLFEEIAVKRGIVMDVHTAALGLTAQIEGLWLLWCLDSKAFTASHAEVAALDFIDRVIGDKR